MEWHDEGVLIACRRHGEGGAIVELFTAGHGRHAGYVAGGGGRRMAPLLQPGAQLAVTWRARLAEHMGHFRVEPLRARASALFADPPALAALASISALLSWSLPEREAHPALYADTIALMDRLGASGWQAAYARWELMLLRELGFGLDLGRCAVTGQEAGLVFVSPKSGRAVSADGAGEWRDRLLALPAFLLDDTIAASAADIAAALRLTGHFLEGWLGAALERPRLPDARQRLAARLARSGGLEDQKLHPLGAQH
ncbi:MAG: DNA repair protein RecO [Alphaproteobacteria bacterium]|nr:MAG: DNA repair protein RecO [Alphaproteobacteria bacterium]